jgi:ABC-type Fe3+-hydroxamate transport system substrate-binding protein
LEQANKKKNMVQLAFCNYIHENKGRSMVIDDIGQRLSTHISYRRIISLVPSTTETLFSLGLGDRLVGCTRFCVHPVQGLQDIPKVGGTKDIDIENIQEQNPDLVIANAEENTTTIFEDIRKCGIPLYVAFPKTIIEALEDLLRLGMLLGVPERSKKIHSQILTARSSIPTHPTFSFAYLIWRNPWMAITDDCFISDMISQFGGKNIFTFSQINTRYPEIQPEELQKSDVVFLSSEPFPFQQKHIDELQKQTSLVRERFQLIDGELSSWHGSRMLQTFLNAQNFINRDAISCLSALGRM